MGMFAFTDRDLSQDYFLKCWHFKIAPKIDLEKRKACERHMKAYDLLVWKKFSFSQSSLQGCKATGDYKANIYLENVVIELNKPCKSKISLL